MQRLRLMIFAVLLLTLSRVAAQPAPLSSLTPDVVTVLNNLNIVRGGQRFVLFAPNATLNQVAEVYLTDLLSRTTGGMTALGDTFLTNDKRNLEKVLAEKGYPQFSDGYVADMMTLIGDFDPSLVMSYWLQHWRSDTTLQSRKMVREKFDTPPIFSYNYREVGIAYQQSADNGRQFYVLVFGSQPGVLPAVVTDRANKYIIAESVTSPDVTLYINTEDSHDGGDGEFIGEVKFMRITEQPDDVPCPTSEGNDWTTYRKAVFRTLTGDYGVKTFHIQLCDGSTPPRTLTVTTSVNYVQQIVATPAAPGGTPTPDVLNIANATQTAAASATSYAPYLATVESILTATAAAP